MSSLQIAEIAKKQHRHVMEAIRKMEPSWEKVNGSKFRLVEYTDAKGERRPCYMLTKLECLYIATKFNDEARARLVLRWQELETASQPKVPTTFREALLLAAAQQEQIEKQQAEITMLSDRIDTMQPKADYCDLILQSPDPILVTQIAEDYGMSAQELNKRLHALGIQHKKNGQWVLYIDYKGLGYTDSMTGVKRNSYGTWMNTVWTQKGRLFLYNKLKEAGVLPNIERYSGYQLPPIGKPMIEDNPIDSFYR